MKCIKVGLTFFGLGAVTLTAIFIAAACILRKEWISTIFTLNLLLLLAIATLVYIKIKKMHIDGDDVDCEIYTWDWLYSSLAVFGFIFFIGYLYNIFNWKAYFIFFVLGTSLAFFFAVIMLFSSIGFVFKSIGLSKMYCLSIFIVVIYYVLVATINFKTELAKTIMLVLNIAMLGLLVFLPLHKHRALPQIRSYFLCCFGFTILQFVMVAFKVYNSSIFVMSNNLLFYSTILVSYCMMILSMDNRLYALINPPVRKEPASVEEYLIK